MDNEKIDTIFKDPIATQQYSENMFTKAVGDKYAKKFHEVYYDTIETRDSKMKQLFEESKEDESLSILQKKIISKCYIAYLSAVGCNCNVSVPILSFIEKKKPSITKVLKSDVRTKRMFIDLQDVVDRTGFKFEVYSFPSLLRVFMVQFRQKDLSELDSSDYWFEGVVITALSKFTRVLPAVAIPIIWYALMFMKNIASLSYIKEETYKENEHIKPQVTSIMKTLYAINLMEDKRITSQFIDNIVCKKEEKKEAEPSTSE